MLLPHNDYKNTDWRLLPEAKRTIISAYIAIIQMQKGRRDNFATKGYSGSERLSAPGKGVGS